MSDIVLLDKPRLIEVQALQPLVSAREMSRDYDPKNPAKTKLYRFVRIEDGLKQLHKKNLTLAEWLEGDWPFDHNSCATLCPWGAIITDGSFQVDTSVCNDRDGLKQAMLAEVWDNAPIREATPVTIHDGKGKFFCTLFDALRYVHEKTGRQIVITLMTQGIEEARRTTLSIRNFFSREKADRYLLFVQPAA